jgi:Sulfotransferase family
MAVSYAASQVLDVYPSLDPVQLEGHLRYASYASLTDRFVYLAVPKAACTTMKGLLRDLHGSAPLKLFAGPNRETRRDMFIHSRENIPFPSLNSLESKQQRELLEAPDVFRFAVVRNPYSRLISAWRDKVFLCEPSVDNVYAAVRGRGPALEQQKRLIDFAEFVSYIANHPRGLWDEHWRKQVDLIFPKAISYTHIGKVEDLDSTLQIFSRHLGRQEMLNVPRENEGSIRLPAKFSIELAERVCAIYMEDFLTFGYDPKSWPIDEQARTRVVSEERFINEIVERNLVISYLYDERDRLMKEYNDIKRFSLVNVWSKLRRAFTTDEKL